jgi:hypothetical protein
MADLAGTPAVTTSSFRPSAREIVCMFMKGFDQHLSICSG